MLHSSFLRSRWTKGPPSSARIQNSKNEPTAAILEVGYTKVRRIIKSPKRTQTLPKLPIFPHRVTQSHIKSHSRKCPEMSYLAVSLSPRNKPNDQAHRHPHGRFKNP